MVATLKLHSVSPHQIESLSDEQIEAIARNMRLAAAPWQYSPSSQGYADADGFPLASGSSDKDESKLTRRDLQLLCWEKFNRNPHINTSVRGLVGRLCGQGFATMSDIQEIQDAID